MKHFLIEGGTLRVSSGTALLLTAAQIASRLHAVSSVDKMPEGDARAACTAKQALEFKSGETVGIAEDDIAKPFRGLVTEVDKNGRPVVLASKGKTAAKTPPAAAPSVAVASQPAASQAG